LATPLGTQLINQDEGYVKITNDKLLGNTIRLKLQNGHTIIYGHLSQINVKEGQYPAGTLLGLTGGVPGMHGAGHSNGSHIHVSEKDSSGTLINPYNYLFHHEQIQYNNYSPFLFPMMLIILLFVLWKLKKYIIYMICIILVLSIIFIVS
jgi:murein DD-endopeptidase MepM/ murein hydrolase activator NlpD